MLQLSSPFCCLPFSLGFFVSPVIQFMKDVKSDHLYWRLITSEYSSIFCIPELNYGALPGATIACIALELPVFWRGRQSACVKAFRQAQHVCGFQPVQLTGTTLKRWEKSWSETSSLLKSIELPLVWVQIPSIMLNRAFLFLGSLQKCFCPFAFVFMFLRNDCVIGIYLQCQKCNRLRA